MFTQEEKNFLLELLITKKKAIEDNKIKGTALIDIFTNGLPEELSTIAKTAKEAAINEIENKERICSLLIGKIKNTNPVV